MAFGLFKKYCQICGREVNKNKNTTRFGKHFCSEEHAEQYVNEQRKIESLERQMMQESKPSKSRSGGGCCG